MQTSHGSRRSKHRWSVTRPKSSALPGSDSAMLRAEPRCRFKRGSTVLRVLPPTRGHQESPPPPPPPPSEEPPLSEEPPEPKRPPQPQNPPRSEPCSQKMKVGDVVARQPTNRWTREQNSRTANGPWPRYQADSDDAPTSATGPSDAGTRPNTIPYGRYMAPRGLASTERAASTPARSRWAGMPRTRPANSAPLGVRLGIHRAQPRSAQNKANDGSAWGGWSIGHALRWARSRAGNHRTRPPERSDGLKKRSQCADRHHAHQPTPS
jgi:hypothetical protein